MARTWAVLSLLTLLGGCDLAGSGAATTAGATSAAQQAGEAKGTEERVRRQIDAADQQAVEQRHAAEQGGQ